MSAFIKQLIIEFDTVTAVSAFLFGNLSAEQLNWMPSEEKWSIAQCFHHLIVSNSTYYPQLNDVIAGKHKNSFYQNIKVVSRFFGTYLIRETGAIVSRPMKSPSAFKPSYSQLPVTILADFQKSQKELSEIMEKLESFDMNNTVISSPALSIITYNLNDLFTIIAGHEKRHLSQATGVFNHANFPK